MSNTSKPKLLDSLGQLMRRRRYAERTIEAYRYWIKRYILFHNKRHPKELGPAGVETFLNYLATNQNVSPSTQNQALSALLFLYRHLLATPLPSNLRLARSRKTPKQPTILSVDEVASVLESLHGTFQLIAQILYGGGLRIGECVKLRVKDLDF